MRQGNAIGAAFHPELTDDTRLYDALVELVRSQDDGARRAQDDAA